MSPDVLVIGGGLHGCSAALHCALAGLRVVVLEREHVGRHASGVNAGGVRTLGRHIAEIPLALASMRMWHAIGDLVDDDCGYRRSGQIKVAASEAEFHGLRQRVETLRAGGYRHEELVTGNELYDLLPALAPGLPGAIVVREDGFANPYRTTTAFRRRAAALGVTFREQTPVIGLRRDGAGWCAETPAGEVRAGAVVNCAGAWSAVICTWLDEPVPVEPIAPMMTITSPLPWFVTPVVGFAGRPLSFKQMANGTVMIGGGYSGTADLATGLTRLRLGLLSENVGTAILLFPIMREANIVRFWAGIEAAMPDGLPVIGPGRHEGVFHGFGFSAHGFQLGPIVGRILAELVQGRPSPLPIEPFSIGRFQTDTLSGRSTRAAAIAQPAPTAGASRVDRRARVTPSAV